MMKEIGIKFSGSEKLALTSVGLTFNGFRLQQITFSALPLRGQKQSMPLNGNSDHTRVFG